jgi:putative transposase
MRAYSIDLRERVVAAVLNGGQTQQAVADRFAVSADTVRRYLRQYRERDGDLSPRSARGAARRVPDALLLQVEGYVAEHPGSTIEQVRAWLKDTHGLVVSTATAHRMLGRLSVTWKKSHSGQPSKTVRSAPPGE